MRRGQVRLVAEGHALVAEPGAQEETLVVAIRLRDRRRHILDRIPAGEQLSLRGVAGGAVFYRVGSPPTAGGRSAGLMGVEVLAAPGTSGATALGADPGAPQVKAGPRPLAGGAPGRFVLRRAPLGEGTPVTLVDSARYAGAGVPSPRGYFWLRAAPGTDRTELLLTPHAGGPPQLLVRGLPSLPAPGGPPSLAAAKAGVWVRRPRAGVRSAPDLVLYTPPSGSDPAAEWRESAVLRGYGGTDPPVEVGGWLYWLHEVRAARPEGSGAGSAPPLVRRELLRASPDGSRREQVLNLTPGPGSRGGVARLLACRGRLYALTYEPAPPGVAGEPGRERVYLARLDPGPPAALRRAAELPTDTAPPAFSDGDDLYFTLHQLRENWLDWSSGGAPRPTPVQVLYRVRLRD